MPETPVHQSVSQSPSSDHAAAWGDGVVCYAGVDWWYHNRGHSECQIMRRLARRVPVLWVNSIGMRVPTPGKTDMFLSRYLRKLKSTLRLIRKDESGMWVYSPMFVPWYAPGGVELNGALLAAQTSTLCRWIGIRRPAAWVTLPTAAAAIERGSWSRVVVNRCDDYSTFPEADQSQVKTLERRLLARADHALYVSKMLLEQEMAFTGDAIDFGHGVDFAHFAIKRACEGSHEIPAALREAVHPIIGFFGAIDDYTFDLELMVRIARHVPHASLVVIGRRAMDISQLLAEPNVKYLGPIPYTDLPLYACQFDVSIMPKLCNEFVRVSNPIKLKEYLALGAPVVTTRFPAVTPYENLMVVADSHTAFLKGIDSALADTDPVNVQRRRDAVAKDSWDALATRAAQLLRLGVV